MPITPNTFNDGDVLTAAVIQAELTRIRTWTNGGIVATDINSSSITAEKVYRPDTFGYPKQAVETVVQQLGSDEWALSEPARGVTFGDVTKEFERDSIFPEVGILPDGSFRVPHAADRIVLTQTGDVHITAVSNWVPVYNNVSGPPAYPATFGALFICYSTAGPGQSKTTISHSRRRLNVGQNTFLATNKMVQGATVEDLPAGKYDFWLEYRSNGASADFVQVIVSTRSFVVEVQE